MRLSLAWACPDGRDLYESRHPHGRHRLAAGQRPPEMPDAAPLRLHDPRSPVGESCCVQRKRRSGRGLQEEIILERHPELLFVYNPLFDQTNTSQSLLIALRHLKGEDVLVLNGDVVFDPRIIDAMNGCQHSSMAVVKSPVGEEEVKFRLDGKGRVAAVSKTLSEAPGEAIGINLIRAQDVDLLLLGLERCGPMDYFERGIEVAIANGLALSAVDVTDYPCVEIDCIDDLNRAKAIVDAWASWPAHAR